MISENEIARIVVNLCYQIHKKYGPGLFESVYERILIYELRKLGLVVEQQKSIPLIHEDLFISRAFRADIIIEGKVLVELKSVDHLPAMNYKQVVTYLKLTDFKLGLLVNFNVSLIKDGIHRIVNNI
jgi:GxxExxY protein